MGDLKNQAYALYKVVIQMQRDNVGNNDANYVQSVRESKNRVSCMVDGYLQNCRPEEKFRQKEFQSIIFLSAKDENFHPKKTAEAFENLENYIVLIYSMPWKKEFHKINKYCGFYQAKVHAHLKNVESIFRLVGYTEAVTGMLVRTITPNAELLKSVAFECLVASVQCKIIYRISKRTLGYHISFSDIVYIAVMQTATEDQIVEYIQSYLRQVQSQTGSGNLSASQNVTNGVKNNARSVIVSTESFRNKLQNYMQQAEKLQSPNISEEAKAADYTVGCLDEHILASLNLVEHSQSSPSNDNTLEMKPSQEWSFVREGITKKYGEKYYDGIRKDILDAPKPHGIYPDYVRIMAHTPGYVNVDNNFVQKPDHTMPDGVFTGTIDSHSIDGCPIVNPLIFNENKLLCARGIIPQNKQVTNILVKKQSPPVSLGSDKTYSFQSAPLAKRHSEKKVSNPLASFPVQRTDNNTKNIDDIEMNKNHRASPQVLIGDKMSKSDIVHNSSSSTAVPMTESYNEILNRNVSDNIQPNSVNSKYCSKSTNASLKLHSKSVSVQWHCLFCTYINSTSGNTCEMCAKSRESVEIDAPFAGQCSRICEKCTLENENDAYSCNVCGNVLGGTNTIV